MNVSRRKGREFAMQLLYAVEVGKEAYASALEGLAADPAVGADAKEYGVFLSGKVLEKQEEIDGRIREVSSNWDLERLAVVDRIVIRCAAAELMYCGDVPAKVAINEAIDIAKKFSTGDSSRFVNGVLDAIAKQYLNTNQKDPQDAH